MRKTYYLVLILLFTGLWTQAQDEYEYTPFPDSNAIWSEYYEPPFGSGECPSYHAIAMFNEDTVINSIKYHKLFQLYDTVLNRENAEYIGGIREDSAQRVYCRMKSGETTHWWYPSYVNVNEKEEILLYDFSLKEKDTLYGGNFMGNNEYIVVTNIDTISIHGEDRKKYHFQYSWQKWIEGIGNLMGLLFLSGDLPTNGVDNTLVCFKRDGKQEYFNDQFSECFPGPLANAIGDVDEQATRVFPNPAEESVYFENPGNVERLSIYNLDGKQLIQKPVSNRERISISVSGYSPGMYFYKLIGPSGQTQTGKFIVK
jgi:hypothetical protein